MKREEWKFRIEAALHGAKMKDTPKEAKKKEDYFTFKDPKEYDHLSEEQKKELTKKMKAKHRQWSASLSQVGT